MKWSNFWIKLNNISHSEWMILRKCYCVALHFRLRFRRSAVFHMWPHKKPLPYSTDQPTIKLYWSQPMNSVHGYLRNSKSNICSFFGRIATDYSTDHTSCCMKPLLARKGKGEKEWRNLLGECEEVGPPPCDGQHRDYILSRLIFHFGPLTVLFRIPYDHITWVVVGILVFHKVFEINSQQHSQNQYILVYCCKNVWRIDRQDSMTVISNEIELGLLLES